MSLTRVSLRVLVVLVAATVVAASAATTGRKATPPRIVSAAMQDSDRDARADSVRLAYSARIRHVRDRDGSYPFTVAGYRIRSVSAASGRALVITLVEHARPDPQARPAIRYRRTRPQPVTGLSGAQAAAQLYRSARPHGHTPPAAPPPRPAPGDSDGDRTPDSEDCAPRDAAVHPGAADLPDLAFVDSNCDGIDGTEKDAVFASPTGSDTNPGTKTRPKRQIQAALVVAETGKKHQVLAAAGSYTRVSVVSGVGIYGGYDPQSWARKTGSITFIVGAEVGLFAAYATDVSLQLLSIRAVKDGASAYGIRAINGSKLRLQRVTVTVGNGATGASGANGLAGRSGGNGANGMKGSCDGKGTSVGGLGGESPVGRDGGRGGDGHYESRGDDGAMGVAGTPGGKGGGAGAQGGFGGDGSNGTGGTQGASGAGGTSTTTLASDTWRGQGGTDGTYGAPGNGGGGGGASGGQTGAFVVNGTGNAGSGGGGGGEGGRGGAGGGPGGGSFGVYLSGSSLVVEQSSIAAGNGGSGGRGGDGGAGGKGGAGGTWITHCGGELGRSGHGGRGADGRAGGGGGGGAGGPSVGVMKVGASSAVLNATAVVVGHAGPGGLTGSGGSDAPSSQPGLVQAIYP